MMQLAGGRQIRFSNDLFQAVRSIEADQLASGEIPNYRRLENRGWEYYFSPLVSAYVAEALAVFDPTSHWFDSFVVEQTGERRRFEVSRTAADIRRRIQRFVTWQQSADDTWRFLGRGSSLPPDLDTTACCALVLLDRISVNHEASAGRTERVLRGFRGRGESPAGQERDQWRAWVAEINAFRLTALAGGLGLSPARLVQRFQVAEGIPGAPVLYALGRAWRQCGLREFEPFIPGWVESLLRTQTKEGCFGGPLHTAMGLTALMDFGHDGEEVLNAAGWLSGWMTSPHTPKTEELYNSLCGSPTLTAAVTASALARAYL